MRHRYDTRGIVLSRALAGEDSMYLSILTSDLGLVYARAQGLRKPGAKLASALATLAESDLILVRGKEYWRVAGASLAEDWFTKVPRAARGRAARVAGLLARLVPGESADAALFATLGDFFNALATLPENEHDAVECLAALNVLAALGLDAGEVPMPRFAPAALALATADRRLLITRINRGIEASGL